MDRLFSVTAVQALAAALVWTLQVLHRPVHAICDLQLEQNFNQYPGSISYTEALMRQDFRNTLGPYKQLGPQGACRVMDGEIYGYYPRGTKQ